MKKSYGILIISFSLFLSLFLSSCATTLRVQVTRPGNLNLNGAKSIAVLPFEKGEFSPFDYVYDYKDDKLNYFDHYNNIQNAEKRLLEYIHTNLEKKISKSPYINLVEYVPVVSALKYGNEVPSDAFITGKVVSFKVHDLLKKEKKPIPEDKENNTTDTIIGSSPAEGNGSAPSAVVVKPDFYYEFSYNREVQFIFNYEIVDGKTKQLIGYDTVRIENISDTVKDKTLLPNPYDLVINELESFIESLMRDIQPYNEYKAITLLEDNTKNPRMKEADKLAKDGQLKSSYNAFLSIYYDIHQFEAGYNAAMILMAMGNLEEAESLMDSLYNETRSPKAYDALVDIRHEIKQANRLNNQINSSRSLPDIED